MKSAPVKLALLAGSAVAAAMVAAAVAFNLFIGWKVDADAVADIEYALGMSLDAGTGRTPNFVLLDSSFRIDASERRWSTADEVELATWFSEHPAPYEVRRVTIGDWTCYAALAPAGDFVTYYEDPYYYHPDDRWGGYGASSADGDGCYVAYIDIASEQSLIAAVNMAFAIIAVLGAAIAAYAGHRAGRRIEESQEAQKRFYENMSHDLKTPLAAIRGYAEGVESGVLEAGEAARAIVGETGRMTETIDEILGLSRLESGAVQPRKEAVAVGDFVQDCLMPLEGAVRTKGIDVRLDLAEGEVQADPGLFDHALSNVLTNAVRHAATCVRVTYDAARLSIWNDGGAPAADQLPHLFDRFHAGDGGSTGIGLAIAKEVADLHGWQITARALDDGLEISFTF